MKKRIIDLVPNEAISAKLSEVREGFLESNVARLLGEAKVANGKVIELSNCGEQMFNIEMICFYANKLGLVTYYTDNKIYLENKL